MQLGVHVVSTYVSWYFLRTAQFVVECLEESTRSLDVLCVVSFMFYLEEL